MTALTVVIPTIRESCAQDWLQQWQRELSDVNVVIVEDNPERTFGLPHAENVDHYSWQDIDAELGKESWIIPRRTSACRSFGFLKALQGGADIIWTLDDDCYPEDAWRGSYVDTLKQLLTSDVPVDDWWNTIGWTGLHPRGFPYDIREKRRPVMVHHGLWSNVPDLDGMTQLANPDFRLDPVNALSVVPRGSLMPFCIMNVAFRKEMAPALYMLLMGNDTKGNHWGYDRFDDIWAGVMLKLIADHLNFAVTCGAPGIRHSRASDPHKNKALEAAGVEAHEKLWPFLKDVELTETTVAGCYSQLAAALGASYHNPVKPPRRGYWKKLSSAMDIWADLSSGF